jgi:hypothetical protein
MENITTSVELKKAIQKLEVEQYVSGQELKALLATTVESFKVINLIKNTVKAAITSPFIIENLLGMATRMATGYLSNKLFSGVSGTIVGKVLGPVLQNGLRNIVAHPQDSFKSFGNKVLNLLHTRK